MKRKAEAIKTGEDPIFFLDKDLVLLHFNFAKLKKKSLLGEAEGVKEEEEGENESEGDTESEGYKESEGDKTGRG